MSKTIYIDKKVTVWHRTYYNVEDDETLDQTLLEKIENGRIEQLDSEYLLDTVEEITVEENDGFAVTEIMEDSEIKWADGFLSINKLN